MEETGEPISYLVLTEGTAVFTSDGAEIGTVKRVLADEDADIFDGLIIDTDDGDRFVDGAGVDSLHERAVMLLLSAEEADDMPEPTPRPPDMSTHPDDVADEGPAGTVGDRLRRAWDRISGNY